MDTANFSIILDTGIQETLLKLRETLSSGWFEIVAENDISDIAGIDSDRQSIRLLCNCKADYSLTILKNEKALYIPAINLVIHELDQNNTEITFIDPQLSMTPIQIRRAGQAIVKVSEEVKKVIQYLNR